MKIIQSISLATFVAYALTFPVHATSSSEDTKSDSRLSIEFIEPEKFTDVRPSNEPRGKFRKHVLSSMEEYFSELADTLALSFKQKM